MSVYVCVCVCVCVYVYVCLDVFVYVCVYVKESKRVRESVWDRESEEKKNPNYYIHEFLSNFNVHINSKTEHLDEFNKISLSRNNQ